MLVSILDAAEVAGTRRTKDGYLVAEVRAARTGIQQYAGHEVGRPDLQTVNVWRPAEEVFKKDSLASYAFKPVTIEHPADGVTADTWKSLAVGNVGGDVVNDGGFVRVPLVLMDATAIAAVESGKRELSMGYDVRLEFVDGVTPEGERYQAVQRDIRINHCAIVDRGRAGPQCRIGDKGGSGRSNQPDNAGDKQMTLRKIVVDGLTIEVTDAGAEAIAKRDKQIEDQAKAIADAKAAIDTATETIKTLKADHAKALSEAEAKIPTADQLETMLKSRSALIDTARKLVGDIEGVEKMSAADVRSHVVAKKLGPDAVKDKGADYVAAQFDTLAAIGGNGGGSDPVRGAIAAGPQMTGDASAARSKYLADQAKAWAA